MAVKASRNFQGRKSGRISVEEPADKSLTLPPRPLPPGWGIFNVIFVGVVYFYRRLKSCVKKVLVVIKLGYLTSLEIKKYLFQVLSRNTK